MTATHTPGPWDFEFREMGGYDCMTDAFDVTAGHKHIASLDLGSYGQSRRRENDGNKSEAAANAHLIAAAPDLLDVVKRLMTLYTTFDAERPFSAITSVFDAARAAIAKAEGR